MKALKTRKEMIKGEVGKIIDWTVLRKEFSVCTQRVLLLA